MNLLAESRIDWLIEEIKMEYHDKLRLKEKGLMQKLLTWEVRMKM